MGKKSEQSKRAYNAMAKAYDSTHDGQYTKAHKVELIRRVLAKEGDKLLDVACGNGTLLRELSKKAKIRAFGLDLSENMIAMAKERCPQAIYVVGECVPLKFESETMDIITVSCAFHHFENPQGFADECKRVLKPNGAIYMAEPYFPLIIRWIANGLLFPFLQAGDVKVYSERALGDFFKRAGFRKIQTDVKRTVLFLKAEK